METTILNSNGYNYISDVLKSNNMADLPDNVMLNKVTTGSGMTSVAIKSEVPYVIAVPFKRLIQNKLEWAKLNNIDMLGVYSYRECGNGVEEIEKFTGNKIMVTYDSLHKVVTALTNNGRIGEFKIMIDEAHHIIKSGNFRHNTINKLLDQYLKFKSFIFGTATPIDDRYQHPRLKNIPKVQIKWDNLQPVTINYCVYYEDLLKAAALAAIEHLNGNMKSNGHFFINSVNDIVSILRNIIKGGYSDPSKIRIITAGTDENEGKLIGGLGKGYKIADINSPSNTVNFYTSTCFEGVDIYDEIGLPYIISNGGKDHSKIDILTHLPQIIGRLRNTKYNNFVNLLYSPNKYYSHTTEDEFERYTKARLKEAAEYVEFFKTAPEMIRRDLLKAAKENIYLDVDDETNEIILNDTALYSEMQNYKTLHTTYYHTAKEKDTKYKVEGTTIISNDIEYVYNPVDTIEIKGLNKAKLGKKANFSEICEKYSTASEVERVQIAKIFPIIEEAYRVLGEEKVKALEFRQEYLKDALITKDKTQTNSWKVANLLRYKVGQWISREEAKAKLEVIYKDLGLNLTAKATDLSNYFELKTSSKRVNNKLTHGFTIILSKFKK